MTTFASKPAAQHTSGAAAPAPAVTPHASNGRVFNFSAGPGCMPEEVIRQVQQDVWNIGGSGIGIMEHSHRGPLVERIFREAEADCRAIGSIPGNYRVIFMTGGASAQNHLIPMNLCLAGSTGDYIVTGYWGDRSYEQAAKLGQGFGRANLAATTKPGNFSSLPAASDLKLTKGAAYLHYVSNETISGVQFPSEPAGLDHAVPLICDASSEMYSKPIDISKYAMIYAGAQKNVGTAGCTLVIIRDDVVERGNKGIADLLQYRTYVPDLSRPNTPPVFAVYVMGLTFKWILRQGGVSAIETINRRKAKHIYDVLDASRFYRGHATRAARSLMNITFRTPSEKLDELFAAEANKQGLDGTKGHRSLGGMRASTYNAFPEAGCIALAHFMREFERTHG